MSDSPSLLRRLFHLAWPVLIAQLAVMANSVIDTLMAGRLSAVDLAAVGIGASIYITIFVSVMGLLLALTPTVAQLYGAGRYAEIGEEVRQSIWLALLLSVVMMFLLLHPDPLLALSQLQPEVESRVRAYLDALAWSVLPALMFRIFYSLTSGIGKTRPIMVFNLAGLVLKVPLNLWFMYGGLGVDAMGGPGCAVATAILNWLTCLMAWIWCARAEECRDYQIFTGWRWPSWSVISGLLKLGLPIGATFFVDVTAFTFMALFIARLGATASAAHQIASNLAALAFMLPLSLGNAASVLAGQALGAGDARQARHAGVATIVIGVGCGVLAGLVLWFGAGFFASLYTGDAQVKQLATVLIGYVAVYHVFDALQAVVMSVLRGYKKTTAPMLIYAVALWGVGLGGGYTLGLTDRVMTPAGAPGFWLAAILSLMLGGGLVSIYFERVSKLARDPDLR